LSLRTRLRRSFLPLVSTFAVTACASAPPCPEPAPPPVCPEPDPTPATATPPRPVRVDLDAQEPQLDRGRTMSLEGFSADGRLALLRVDDGATGQAFQIADLTTGRPTQNFGVMALGEREARVRGTKALGKNPVFTWSNRDAEGRTIVFADTPTHFELRVDAGAPLDTLARLPRHITTDRRNNTTTPASSTRVTIAWAPGGAHVFVIYGQLTADSPPLMADRWFAVPVVFEKR
jgi:hypothetical protein